MSFPALAAYSEEARVAADTAAAAAVAIETVATASTYVKDDGSPVTDADLASDRVIRERLSRSFPGDTRLTEESGDPPERLASKRCWIVDPLDGTAQFIAGTGDYDVLIALVVDGRPVVAASCNPPSGSVCVAVANQGAWVGKGGAWRPFRLRPNANDAEVRIVTSVWYGAPESLPILTQRLTKISPATPEILDTGFNSRYWASPDRPFDAFIGWVPEGWMAGGEWDLVVADLIVHEAGGICTNLHGELHRYNKHVPRNSGGILLTSSPALHQRLLAALSPGPGNAVVR